MCVSELPIPCPSSQLLFIYIDFGLKNICCNAQSRAPPGIDELSYSRAARCSPALQNNAEAAFNSQQEGVEEGAGGAKHHFLEADTPHAGPHWLKYLWIRVLPLIFIPMGRDNYNWLHVYNRRDALL